MSRHILTVALAAVTLLSFAGASRADDSKKPFAVRLGVFAPTDSDVRSASSAGGFFGISLFLNHKSTSQTLLSLDWDGTGLDVSGVNVTSGSFILTGRHFTTAGTASGPYFGLGLGVFQTSGSADGFTVNGDVQVGGKLVGGVMSKSGNFFEGGYVHSGATGSSGLTVTYGFRF